jgi:carotenoid phi-ring synthase / carotenoid chi-ring synthase
MTTPPIDDTFPVVIIGGGLAGLTAALHLAARGLTPLLLDADQRWIGGRLAGGDAEIIEHGGRAWAFPSEHGIHALWGGYHNMRATLERFVPLALLPSDGEVWVNRWGREVRQAEAGTAVRSPWLPAPLHYLQLLVRPRFWQTITPLDFLSLPGYLVSMLWATGLDPLGEGVALHGLMSDQFFRGWTPNLRATFVGLGKNLLAAHDSTISVTALIAALRFYTLLRRETWHPHYLPDNSHTALLGPMVASIERMGGQVWQGVTAQALYHQAGGGWRVVVEDMRRRGWRTLHAQQVILATHAPAARRLLDVGDTAAHAHDLDIPSGLRTTTVRLWFGTTPPNLTMGGMFTGHIAFDNFFWLHRLQPPFVQWHAATGGSAIELHLYGTDAQMDESEHLLIVRAVDEVQRAWPQLRGQFLHGAVRRNSKTHTQFRIPTARSLHVATPWAGVHACGDWVGYATPSLWMERASTTAIAAANAVLAAHGQAPYPILHPAPAGPLAQGMGALVRGGRALVQAVRRR